MPDNIGDAVGRIIIDTSSVDTAVRRMQDASSRITRLMRDIDGALSRAADSAMSGSTRMVRAQAEAMRAHAAEMKAQAQLITATQKAESDKRIAIARDETARINAEMKMRRESERAASTGGSAGQQGRSTIRAIQEQLRESEMRLKAQQERFKSMGGTPEQRSDVQRLIDTYSNDIRDAKVRLQELKTEFANFLRDPGGSVSPQKGLNRLNDITSSFSGGVGWEVTPQVSKFGHEQAARDQAAANSRMINDAMAGIGKRRAAEEAAAKKDLDNILRLQQETRKLEEAKKRAASQQLMTDQRQSTTGAQSAINAARAQISALENEFKRLANSAPSNIRMDDLAAGIATAKQPILDLQAELARLRSELLDTANTPKQRMAIIGQMNQVRQAALQAGNQGLDPLRMKMQQMDRQVSQATSGLRGYFSRLRGELEDINRRSLGKNIQELGFRLSPIALGAGAAVGRGTNVAMEMEEANLAFRAMTDSEEEANRLMDQLTDSARRFGLPIVDTFKAMQRFIPLIRQSGGELSKVIEIAARLQTLNPAQGFEGAMFSITEAMASGAEGLDAISLRERFGIVPDQLRQARAETGDLVSALDLVLNRMDRTTELAEQFGQTTRASFTRARDALDQFLGKAVVPILNAITPIIEGFTRFLSVMEDMDSPLMGIVGTIAAVTAGVIGLTFAVGNLVIAGEAIAGVFSALTGASAAVSGIGAAAGTAGAGGLVAGLAALAPVLLTLLPIVGAMAFVFHGLSDMASRVEQAALDAKDLALEPLAETLERIAAAGDSAVIPTALPVGSSAAAFARRQEQIQSVAQQLEQEYQSARSELIAARDEIVTRIVNDMTSIEAADPGTFAGISGAEKLDKELGFIIMDQLNAALDQAVNGVDAASRLEGQTSLFEILSNFSDEQMKHIAEYYASNADMTRIIELLSTGQEGIDAVRTQLDEANLQAATNAFNQWKGDAKDSITAFYDALYGDDGIIARARENEEKAKQLIEEFASENQRTFEDRSLDAAREIEDFELQRARAIEDMNQQILDEEDDYQNQRQRMIDDYNAQIEDENADFNEKSLKQWEDYQEDLRKSAEDHLKEMRRMQRDVDDAISARDFLGAQKALQKMMDAEEDFNVEQQRRREDFERQQAELIENLEKQREKRQDDFDQQLKDFDDNYEKQKRKRDDAFALQLDREDQDRRIRQRRQLEDFAIMDMRRREDFQKQLDALSVHNELIEFYTEYGLNAVEQKFLEFATGLSQMQVAQPAGSNTPYGGIGTVTDILGPALPTWLENQGSANSNDRWIPYGGSGIGGFADGIWNLDRTQMAKVHEGEMIVPQPFAESVRRGDTVIGSRQGGGGGGKTFVFAPQISVDARGNTIINKRELIDSLKEELVEEMATEFERQASEFDLDRN
jgi:hypothetical protein